MPQFQTRALVLRTYDFSEADRIIVLFTEKQGKCRAVAKGVRRTTSRLAGSLGWLSFSELQLHGQEHRELFRITQAQLLHAYPRLKKNLESLGRAARMAELIFHLAPDHQVLPEIFELLVSGLTLLDSGTGRQPVAAWFEISFLERMGYRPGLEACRQCGQDREAMAYHPESGGMLCRNCCAQGGVLLSPGSRRVLLKLMASAPGQVPRLQWNASMEKEIRALLDSIIRFHVGKPLNSDSFCRAVEGWG